MKTYELTSKEDAGTELQLDRPIVISGEKVEKIYFREITINDFIEIEAAATKGSTLANVTLISLLAGISPAVVKTMKSSDFFAASSEIESFLSADETEALAEIKGMGKVTSAVAHGS